MSNIEEIIQIYEGTKSSEGEIDIIKVEQLESKISVKMSALEIEYEEKRQKKLLKKQQR
jgi:hypothetical protein